MRDNILIHNLEEEENEDLSQRVPMLIKEHLQLDDIGFIRIHRNGTRSRVIQDLGLLQLKNSSVKDRVLNAIRQKRETFRQSDMPFFITPQTPLQVNETKKKLQEMNTKYREENVKTKKVGNKLCSLTGMFTGTVFNHPELRTS